MLSIHDSLQLIGFVGVEVDKVIIFMRILGYVVKLKSGVFLIF